MDYMETPVMVKPENVLKKLWRIFVIRPIFKWQELRCAACRQYLLTHDHDYRTIHVGLELVRRRDYLREQGVSPMDPQYPDRWDIEDELPRMKWPHKNVFDQ